MFLAIKANFCRICLNLAKKNIKKKKAAGLDLTQLRKLAKQPRYSIKIDGKKVSPEDAKAFTLEDVKAIIENEIPNAFKKKNGKKK